MLNTFFQRGRQNPLRFPLLRACKCHTSCGHNSPRRRGKPDAFWWLENLGWEELPHPYEAQSRAAPGYTIKLCRHCRWSFLELIGENFLGIRFSKKQTNHIGKASSAFYCRKNVCGHLHQ